MSGAPAEFWSGGSCIGWLGGFLDILPVLCGSFRDLGLAGGFVRILCELKNAAVKGKND